MGLIEDDWGMILDGDGFKCFFSFIQVHYINDASDSSRTDQIVLELEFSKSQATEELPYHARMRQRFVFHVAIVDEDDQDGGSSSSSSPGFTLRRPDMVLSMARGTERRLTEDMFRMEGAAGEIIDMRVPTILVPICTCLFTHTASASSNSVLFSVAALPGSDRGGHLRSDRWVTAVQQKKILFCNFDEFCPNRGSSFRAKIL